MQSCEFGLTMKLFILLHAFPTLIGFFKKIARQNMLMVHINKKIPKLLLFILVMQLLISYLVISEIDASQW